MLDGALNFANFGALAALLLWPTNCPDLACPETQVVERVPAVVEKSLDFALSTAETCRAKSDGAQLSFWLFWLGFIAGASFVVVVFCALRCLRSLTVPVQQEPTPVRTSAPALQLPPA